MLIGLPVHRLSRKVSKVFRKTSDTQGVVLSWLLLVLGGRGGGGLLCYLEDW